METGSDNSVATEEILSPLQLLKIAHCNASRQLQADARLSLISAPLPFFITSDFINTGFIYASQLLLSVARPLGWRNCDVKKKKKITRNKQILNILYKSFMSVEKRNNLANWLLF